MNLNRLANVAMATMALLMVFLAVEINHVWNTAATTNTVSFSGEGKVTAKPDIAVISAGVLTQSADSKAAQDANSTKSKAITDYLKSQGIEDKDIKTSDYNIYPQYNYSGGQSNIIGYQVSENYQIKVRDLNKVSAILSGLVKAGANQVNNLGLQIENPDSLKDQARQLAIEDAKKKAQTLQGQVGIKLGHIVNFSENSVGGPIYYDAKATGLGGGSGAPSPSIQTGENEITIDVTLTYQIK